ncbi:MAG: hypothetical protein ACO3Q7_08535, partial [Steroidobacteraceae bacterium]
MAGMYQANDTSGLWRGALLAFCLAAAASGVQAQETANRLVSVEVKPLSGTSVQVRLNTTAPAP